MGKCMFMRKGEAHTAPIQGLPNGYTELSYIESTGTQYIDTGFKPNINSKLALDFEFTSIPSGNCFIFGTRNQADGKSTPNFSVPIIVSGPQYRYDWFGMMETKSISTLLKRLTFVADKNTCSLDGTAITYSGVTFGQATQNLYLFCVNTAGTAATFASYKMYFCQIYDNDILVRDYVPCVNPDGEIGLYDRVTKTFFGNAGTGYFSGMDLDGNAVSASIKASDLAVGSTVKLTENGSPVEYLVVHNGLPSSMYDASCNGIWLLRKDTYEKRQFHSSQSNKYSTSTVHNYLNNDYLSIFDSTIRGVIKQVKIPCGSGVDVTSFTNIDAKVFLLSGAELGWGSSVEGFYDDGSSLEYYKNTYGGDDSKRIAKFNGTSVSWWMRTPNSGNALRAMYVTNTGGYGSVPTNNSNVYIRPALILPSNALFDADTMILKGVAPSEAKTMTVNATDSANATSVLLTSAGELMIGETKITQQTQVVELQGQTVLVKYTLSRALSTPRTVVVNGTTLGTVSAQGASVSAEIPTTDGGTITVEFRT